MKSSKIKLAEITVDAPGASKKERLVINDFFMSAIILRSLSEINSN